MSDMTVLDYLKKLYMQNQGDSGFSMPPQDASLYGDRAPMFPVAQPQPMQPTQFQPQQAPGALSPIAPVAMPGASPMAPVDAPTQKPGILDFLHNPGMRQALLSAGAAMLQAGGPSDKPVSTGQGIAAALSQGTNAYNSYNDKLEADAARKQALAGQQWHTLGDAELKKAGLTQPAPGYVWQANGNGEVKQVGQDVIKSGIDASGMPTLIDTRKLGQGGNAPSAPGVIPGPYDPDTLNTAATVVMSDPSRIRDYASFGQTGMAARMQIQKAMSQKLAAAGMTNEQLVALRARAHAETGNLSTLTKQQAQVNAADQLVHANGDRLLELFDMVDQTGIPMIEGISRSARAKAGGVDAAELKSVLTTFQTEVARVLSGNPNMTGVISDDMRHEIEKMVSGNMSTAQAKRVINRLYLETSIRQQAINDQLNRGVNTSVVSGQSAPPSATPPNLQSMSNDELLKALGVSGG